MTSVTEWPEVGLGDVCEFKYGKSLPAARREQGAFSVYGSNGVVGEHSEALTSGPTIIVGRKGSFGEVNYSDSACWPIDTTYFVDATSTKADLRWLAQLLPTLLLTELNRAAAIPGLNREDAYRRRCLLPPIDEQRRIAAILDQADALRAKRHEALAHLDDLTQSIFLDMFGDPVINVRGWESLPLTDVCHAYSGGTPSMSHPSNWVGSLPWFSPKDMKRNDLFDSLDHISEAIPRTTSLKLLPPETVAIVVRGMILAHTFPVCVLRVPATINQDMKALLPRRSIETQFLAACLRAQAKHVLSQVSTAAHGTKRLDAEGLSLRLNPAMRPS